MPKEDNKDIHYVNNKEFYEEMKQYIYNKRENPDYKIPNHIGLKIVKICTKLSYRPNFINYTYREDMVGDAIENCIAYIDNFNPDKSNNPFSYFTQIAWYAYLRRIAKENKTTKLKVKYVKNLPHMQELFDHLLMDSQDHDDMQEIFEHITETVQRYYNIEDSDDDTDSPKKVIDDPEKVKKTPIDDFLED